jgi:hypothetical protein
MESNGRDRRHIVLQAQPNAARFLSYNKRPPSPGLPPNRATHGAELTRQWDEVIAAIRARLDANTLVDGTKSHGAYVEFESRPGATLDVTKLEMRKRQIEVVASSQSETETDPIQRATLFVPPGQAAAVRERMGEYTASEDRGDRLSATQRAFDAVGTVRAGTVRSLWTDRWASFPADSTEARWWEVWLRSAPAGAVNRFHELATRVGVHVRRPSIRFFERDVVLAHGSVDQLSQILDVFDQLAELRRPAEFGGFFHHLLAAESVEWGSDLLARVRPPKPDAPAVCLLDAGITRSHPLLAVALDERDCHSVVPDVGPEDCVEGHGTAMAGLALYGDLTERLSTLAPVSLTHRLESVRLYHSRPVPKRSRKASTLERRWCDSTIDAVHRVECVSNTRARCFSLAVSTIESGHLGRPSAWSALLDALTFGRKMTVERDGNSIATEQRPRLMIVAAGNIRS